jgi:RNA exonuclease 4
LKALYTYINALDSRTRNKFNHIHLKFLNIHRKIPSIKSLFPLKSLKNSQKKITPVIALDAEMLICEDNSKQIGRLSIVNFNRVVLYDSFFKPSKRVKNYLTRYSGLTFLNTNRAPLFEEEKEKIEKILKNAVIVGHSLSSDQEVLNIKWNWKQIRDISLFPAFKKGNKKTSLKDMTEKYLEIEIQNGEHSSVEDARAALEVYKLYKREIDEYSRESYFNNEKRRQRRERKEKKNKPIVL